MEIRTFLLTCIMISGALQNAAAQTEPTITKWKFNLTNAKGYSTNSEVNSYINAVTADVLEVWHTGTDVYIKANSMPSHSIGPWTGRAEYPTAANNTWMIKRTAPSAAAVSHPTLPLGPIGVFVNGVQLFSWSDATSYENEGYWNNVAPVARPDIDSAGGHPSPGMPGGFQPEVGVSAATDGHTHSWTDDPYHSHGASTAATKVLTAGGSYHYHTQSPALRQQLNDTGVAHSPILGFAFDGSPIYGPYGYANSNGTGGVRRIVSSYQSRTDMVSRTTLPDGTVLAAQFYGPAIAGQYPLGRFAEDYKFINGSGDLDVYNGRFTVTPEYPAGVYAYFTTIDASGNSAFPYTVGPASYYGTVIAGNTGPTGGHVTIPGGAVHYTPAASVQDWKRY